MQITHTRPEPRASAGSLAALAAGVALAICSAGLPVSATPATGRMTGVVTTTGDLPSNPLAAMALPPPSIARNDPGTLNVAYPGSGGTAP